MAELLAQALIRDIPDFPKPGIVFKDITPVLANAAAFQEVVDGLVEWCRPHAPDAILGIESRGLIFGAPVALAMELGFIPVRKLGKLPHETVQQEYALEYGTSIVEMHRDALRPGARVVIVDDLLATGGTAAATVKLAESVGAVVVGCCFVVELPFLHGRDPLAAYPVHALIAY